MALPRATEDRPSFAALVPVVLILGIIGLAGPSARASHDSGETLTLKGASRDGRFALVFVEDVQGTRAWLRVHEVDRVDPVEVVQVDDENDLRQAAHRFKRQYRLRTPPTARVRDKRSRLTGRFYDWKDPSAGHARAFALVGRLGQRVYGPWSVACLNDPAYCRQEPGDVLDQAAKVHWFRSGVFLVATTWTALTSLGRVSRPIYVHARVPRPPERPATSPIREKEP